MREEAEKEYRAAPLPQYLAEDREYKSLRLIWTASAERSGSVATAAKAPSLKEQIAELVVIGVSLLEPAAMTHDELLDAGREIEILSVLEISPRLNNASATLERESARIYTRLLVLDGTSMLAMLTAVIGCLFWILLPMERRVTAAQDSLEQTNSGLEQTVAERTAELEAANRTLRALSIYSGSYPAAVK